MRSANLGNIPNLPEKFGKDFALELFKRANFSRHFEFKVKEAHDKKVFTIPIYLSVGSEFNAAVFSILLEGSQIFAQHRCHSLYLSFGGDPSALRDELLGLPSGCSGGMSGSNAIQGRDINMFGHSGLMGEQIPIACGAAFASNKPCLAICGDASVEEDYIYPSLGWAASKKLPIIFICEDNDLSILTKVEVRRNWSPAPMAKSLGIPAFDITDCPWLIAHHLTEMKKDMPGFLNIRTVRHLWHAGTGVDNQPEWDRYSLVKESLVKLGLGKEIEEIDVENKKRAHSIWADVLAEKS